MTEILLGAQLYQRVNTGLQVEGTVHQTIETGVRRQELLLLSGGIIGKCMEGVQRVRSEMAMLRNFMLERSILILSSVSLAFVASGCCPSIPGKVDWEMISLGGIGGCICGVSIDFFIVVLKKGKLKSVLQLFLIPIAGGIAGMILPEEVTSLCLFPGMPILGLTTALYIKSKHEERQ